MSDSPCPSATSSSTVASWLSVLDCQWLKRALFAERQHGVGKAVRFVEKHERLLALFRKRDRRLLCPWMPRREYREQFPLEKGLPFDTLRGNRRSSNRDVDLAIPPAQKLDLYGKFDELKATAAELRGQEVLFGKGKCATCHTAPYFTDNLMHNLKVERFFEPKMINGRMASADGPIKTFPLSGIKDPPTYLHDDRLMTLDDTVEFFNVVLGTKLTAGEKSDLVAFLRCP